ncbi:MAG: hypothetical protein AB8F74_13165 [Saprospiraceae bacterium]
MALDDNKLIGNITKPFSLELKEHESMDDYVDEILPNIKPWSEDLREEEFYLDTRWLEVRDADDFLEKVLHIFRPENEYLHSIDGNISKGDWKVLDKSNTLIIEMEAGGAIIKSELFDLAFLNKDFFILKKHGNQKRKGRQKYLVLGREAVVKNLEWRQVMDKLFSNYKNNSQFLVFMAVIALIIAAVLAFSLF